MEAVIEADAHQRAGACGGGGHGIQFAGAAGAGLFHEHVFAGRGGRFGDRSEHVVGGGDENQVDIGARDGGSPIGERFGAGTPGGERLARAASVSQQTVTAQ